MKKIILALVALGVLLMTGTASALTTDLIADGGSPATEIIVGTVDISDDGTDLTVTITITDTDWILVSTKVDARDAVVDIPQNKNKNPKPGQFRYQVPDPVPTPTNHVYTIPLSEVGDGVDPGDEIYVAVHAKVRDIVNLTEMTIVSGDGQTMVTRRRPGNGSWDTTGLPAAAVRADEPDPYPTTMEDGDADTGLSTWDNQISAALRNTGADWIWESDRVLDPVEGTVITLERTFDIDGYPMSGDLLITCDNGYEAFIGATSAGSANVGADWQTSDLTESFVNTSGWQGEESYNISGLLLSGENVLAIDAANEEMSQGVDGHPADGTDFTNPGACIFALEIESAREETAWGDGTEFNEKKSWAMYIEYETTDPDLVVSEIILDSDEIYHDDPLAFTYTVENVGGEGPPGNSVFDVAGYLSTDAVLDGSDTMILGPGGSSGSYSAWSYHLAVGWSADGDVDDGDITGTSPGTYYLIVDADTTPGEPPNYYPGVVESDEDNNWLAIQFTVLSPP